MASDYIRCLTCTPCLSPYGTPARGSLDSFRASTSSCTTLPWNPMSNCSTSRTTGHTYSPIGMSKVVRHPLHFYTTLLPCTGIHVLKSTREVSHQDPLCWARISSQNSAHNREISHRERACPRWTTEIAYQSREQSSTCLLRPVELL